MNRFRQMFKSTPIHAKNGSESGNASQDDLVTPIAVVGDGGGEQEPTKKPTLMERLRAMDKYGEKEEEYDPASYEKTVSGAILWIVFRLLFVGLVLWHLVELSSGATIIIPGDPFTLNINMDKSAVPYGSKPNLDVPTIDFKIDHKLEFYEEKYPTVQGIDVIDLTGYNPKYSSHPEAVPIARAMYESKTINLNSWDAATQVLRSPEDPVNGNLDGATVDDALHTFSETLKVFYKEGRVFGETNSFYNHTVKLFVRFDASQLADIKMCQLQVALYNKGVFEVLKTAEALDNREYHDPALFPTLVTEPGTYAPQYFIVDRVLDDWSFRHPERNLFILTSRFTEPQLKNFVQNKAWGPLGLDITSLADLEFVFEPGGVHIDDFLNWEYSISYVNNMQMTAETLNCDGKDRFNAKYVKIFPPNATQNFIIVNSTKILDISNGINLPFEVMVSAAEDQEQMFVTKIDLDPHGYMRMWVDRGEHEAAKDLRWNPPEFQCNAAAFTTFAPDEWTCDPNTYW